MAITQTVEIPPNRRLTIEVPWEVPAGMVMLTFTPRPVDETEFLLNSPINRERLLRAAANVERGEHLVNFETLEDAIQAAERPAETGPA
ncbi:MAG: hypothetical protein LBD55_02405 [Treponema sp.]|jgi:hypothetical protein|nr:hypothetical protein [Treponema sp.]